MEKETVYVTKEVPAYMDRLIVRYKLPTYAILIMGVQTLVILALLLIHST